MMRTPRGRFVETLFQNYCFNNGTLLFGSIARELCLYTLMYVLVLFLFPNFPNFTFDSNGFIIENSNDDDDLKKKTAGLFFPPFEV